MDQSALGLQPLSRHSWRGETVLSYSVELLRVEVRVSSYLTADDLPRGGPHDERHLLEAQRVFDEAAPIAVELAKHYVDYIRVSSDQNWLGSSASIPRMEWISELRDAAGRRLAASFGQGISVVLLGADDALSVAGHHAAIESLKLRQAPALADSLLADARFANWPTGNPDRRQAVLLAAIACEVKIKASLRELARREQFELVSLVLENPRDISLAAATLLDKALYAICGRSLRLDNKDLYKDARRLFEDRNAIAHRGGDRLIDDRLTVHVATAHVATARSIFDYLNSLSPRLIE